MFKLNKKPIVREKFPNNETKVKDFEEALVDDENLLEFEYTDKEQLITLMFIKHRIDSLAEKCKLKIICDCKEELFTRENPDDAYKVIDVKVGNAKGYLVAIYEPENVKLLRTKKFNVGTFGERVVDMCKRYGGSVCINAGGFANGLDNGSDIPMGYVIDENEVVWPETVSDTLGDIIGITDEGKLKLMSGLSMKLGT